MIHWLDILVLILKDVLISSCGLCRVFFLSYIFLPLCLPIKVSFTKLSLKVHFIWINLTYKTQTSDLIDKATWLVQMCGTQSYLLSTSTCTVVHSSIIEELLCTLSHKNHLLWNHPWHKGVKCLLEGGQNLNLSPPWGPPPLQKPCLPPCPLQWPVWGGSVGCRSPCEASPAPCRPPAGRCWAAGGEAEVGGSDTAPYHWNVSASQERSQPPGGYDPTGRTVGGSPRQRLPQLGQTVLGGTGWHGGWRRSSSEGQRTVEGTWCPPAAAGNRRG